MVKMPEKLWAACNKNAQFQSGLKVRRRKAQAFRPVLVIVDCSPRAVGDDIMRTVDEAGRSTVRCVAPNVSRHQMLASCSGRSGLRLKPQPLCGRTFRPVLDLIDPREFFHDPQHYRLIRCDVFTLFDDCLRDHFVAWD